ncbi:hypothetical protein KGP36_01925 [Patescibacteria group bacterium]|nr:hypothetical protein [Patescibacteria group bacterium]
MTELTPNERTRLETMHASRLKGNPRAWTLDEDLLLIELKRQRIPLAIIRLSFPKRNRYAIIGRISTLEEIGITGLARKHKPKPKPPEEKGWRWVPQNW